jgi:uncharacterized protein with HEPN domain
MRAEDRVRLRHMLDAAEEAVGFYTGKGSEDLGNARVLLLAIVKDIEIIGEAAAKVSRELQDTFPSIPWSDIIGMRHRLIHAYFDIDSEVVARTVTHDLPPLIAELRAALADRGSDRAGP